MADAEGSLPPPETTRPFADLLNQVRPAVSSVLVLSLLSGCAFPLLLAAMARVLFPWQAGGSLISRGSVVIGSELIGQEFTRPEYFHGRPSAAGNGYDGTASGGTNLGPNNPKFLTGAADSAGVRQLADAYRTSNGLSRDTPIPIDAVTRSASGLDPDISPANAALQAARVARARGLDEDTVRGLIVNHTKGRQLLVLGAPRVSVLELNLALDDMRNGATMHNGAETPSR